MAPAGMIKIFLSSYKLLTWISKTKINYIEISGTGLLSKYSLKISSNE
jgi:hypothetical protein